MTLLEQRRAEAWMTVCEYDDLDVDRGVAALVDGRQVAIFRTADGELYAIDNRDPFSRANVMARGVVGTKQGVPKVASPMYKQTFDLRTGQCFEDPSVAVQTFNVRADDGWVFVERVEHESVIGRT